MSESDTDDASQRVFIVASQRLERIRPDAERAFLFQTALRVASTHKRHLRRRREVLSGYGPDERDEGRGDLESLVDQRRARAVLDEILDGLELDTRAVFILFELEGMTLSEIAETISVPRGTAASRLRRAREAFDAALAKRDLLPSSKEKP